MKLLEPGALLLAGELAVGDVVHAPREGVDRGDRAAFLPRQHHDPVGEVARLAACDSLHLGVGGFYAHRIAAKASRAREGRGLPLKMSQSARSSASSAA